MMRPLTVAAAMLALLQALPGGPAQAQPPPASKPKGEPVELHWTVMPNADSCPDAPALTAYIRGRMGRDPTGSNATRVVEGSFAREANRWVARVVVRDRAGTVLSSREITRDASDCTDLVEASGRMVALIVDPEVRLSPPPPRAKSSKAAPPVVTQLAQPTTTPATPAPAKPPAPPPPTPPTTPAPPPPAPPPAVTAPAKPSTPPPPAPGSAAPPAAARRATASPPKVSAVPIPAAAAAAAPRSPAPPAVAPRPTVAEPPAVRLAVPVRVGVRGILSQGALPGTAPGAAVALFADRPRRIGFGLGLRMLPEQQTSDGDVGIGMSAFWAAACVHTILDDFRWRGCFAASAGIIHSIIHRVTIEPTHPGDRLWLGAGPTGTLSYPVWGPVAIDIGLDVTLPFLRHRFWIEPHPTAAFQQKRIIVEGILGISVEYE